MQPDGAGRRRGAGEAPAAHRVKDGGNETGCRGLEKRRASDPSEEEAEEAVRRVGVEDGGNVGFPFIRGGRLRELDSACAITPLLSPPLT